MTKRTLADAMRDDAELLRRRHVHATRQRGPLSLDEAVALSKRMEGVVECPTCKAQRDACRLCGGSGEVTEQQARDWPDAG